MSYLKINDTDYSMFVNLLRVSRNAKYNSQTNAAGNTVVDYINTKRIIEVGLIPLNDTVMAQLLKDIEGFNVSITYREPKTNELETANCIVPTERIEYYTIQANKVMYQALVLTFNEL